MSARTERGTLQERVEQSLSETYLPEGVRIWLSSRNRMLGLRVPQDMIDAGEGEEVWRLAESLTGMIAT